MAGPITVNHYIWPEGAGGLTAFLDAAVAAGADAVSLTVAALGEMPVAEIRREVEARGLTVPAVNSVGYFTDADPARRAEIDATSRRTIAAAAELGAQAVCLIAGGIAPAGDDLATARARVADGLAALDGEAKAAGIRLGLEPIHPAEIRAKGCVNTIADARAMAAPLSATGLILDVHHSWWDTDLVPADAAEAADILVVQVCDVTEIDGRLRREVPGEGNVDGLAPMRAIAAVSDAALELELFAVDLRGRDPAALIATGIARMRAALSA